MRKYKIYYRFVIPEKYFTSMKMEYTIEAFTCGEACDQFRELVKTDDLEVRIIEVYELVYAEPEDPLVLPEDL